MPSARAMSVHDAPRVLGRLGRSGPGVPAAWLHSRTGQGTDRGGPACGRVCACRVAQRGPHRPCRRIAAVRPPASRSVVMARACEVSVGERPAGSVRGTPRRAGVSPAASGPAGSRMGALMAHPPRRAPRRCDGRAPGCRPASGPRRYASGSLRRPRPRPPRRSARWLDLPASMAPEMAAIFTANSPPNPQQVSALGSSTQ